MKDIHSIEKHLPVVPLTAGLILFPHNQIVVRLTREFGDLLLAAAEKTSEYVVALVTKPSPPAPLGQLHSIGTLAKIVNVRFVAAGVELTLEGLIRVTAQTHFEGSAMMAQFEFLEDEVDLDEATIQVLQDSIKKLSLSILGMVEESEKLQTLVRDTSDLEKLIAFCAQNITMPISEKQAFLELRGLKNRGLRILDLLARQKESIRLQIEMAGKVNESASKQHRENILREQLRMLKEELGESRGKGSEKDLRARVEAADFPAEIREAALEEVDKFEALSPNSPEMAMVRNYLELLLALPWTDTETPDIDLKRAREILDEDHFGLEKVKDLIIQHLAVMKLKKDRRGANLLLVGPPGVGKTSLGKSIARAMNREFIRASLGGVRDDAEIRGHRRTYLGALPGRIVQSMKRAGKKNPVFMLDEIEKLVRGWNGDPASALLEVLDPEQNDTFRDHYLELPYDLSSVFFIATANSLEGIPGPLLDRMEVIHLTGYTDKEKTHIATDYLIPKQLEIHGLSVSQLKIDAAALDEITSEYTREAGVRDLQRKIAAICRVYSEKVINSPPENLPLVVTTADLDAIFGGKSYSHEAAAADNPPGVATGLAWTPMGGDILFIEATSMPGSGHLTLTGQLGDVMKESAQIALSLIRSQLPFMTSHFNFKEMDIHVHVPSGSIPKDGPSAGIAMTTTIASLVLNKKVDPKLALTGEVTLRGAVLPVGGIKEKLIAAHRAGIRTIVMSSKNEKDLKELPAEVRSALTVHFVDKISQVFQIVFGIPSLDNKGGLDPLSQDQSAAASSI